MKNVVEFRLSARMFMSELKSNDITLEQYNEKYQSALKLAISKSNLTRNLFLGALLNEINGNRIEG